MTYEHDFERNRLTGAGLGDYQTSPDVQSGTGKWILFALIAIVCLLGITAIFAGNPGATFNETMESNGQVNVAPPPTTSGTQ